MARRNLKIATALLVSFAGLGVLFFELNVHHFYPFCPKKNDIDTIDFDDLNKTYILRPRVDCKKDPPYLVLLITSTHNQKEARMAIRWSWGEERLVWGKRVSAYFLLGTSQNVEEEANLVAESNTYNDIIQRPFIDSYYNLTIKTIMGISWIYNHCSEATFVMKTDTDMFVNTIYLVQLLLKKNQTLNFFTGFLKPYEHPIRNTCSKWYVSETEYPWANYPPFCSGTGYVFSVDVALKIHGIFNLVPFFKLEDVYVGTCLEKLNINLQELHNEQTFFQEKQSFSVCGYRKLVTSHGIPPHEITVFWELVRKSEDKEC